MSRAALGRVAAWSLAWILTSAAAPVAAAEGVSTDAGSEGPAQTAFAPEKGPGPAVIVISGATGRTAYQSYATELARLGYYTVLLDGNDILSTGREGPGNLRRAIERAQRSPQAVPGKVAVIGFSRGGGGALAHAVGMADLVSAVVVYYPFTSFKAGPVSLVRNFRVPVLFFAAERDRYRDCCLIDSARAIAAAAQESGAKFELVTYPQANHGFNLEVSARGEPAGAYRKDDADDAWQRTIEMLKQHHPLR